MAPLKVLKPALGAVKWELSTMNFKTEAIQKLPDRCYAYGFLRSGPLNDIADRSPSFLDSRDYKPTDGRRELILAYFGVPKFVANRTCFESNGFFGHRVTYGERKGQKRITGCTTWFRCLCKMVKRIDRGAHEDGPEYAKGEDYKWYEMTVFTRWEYPDKCQVLCIDTPFDLSTQLQAALLDREAPLDFRDPFAMHVDLWDRIIVYSDTSVWRVRDPVRRLEESRLRPGEMFLPAHEFSRHAIHVSEVLEAAVETITAIDRCQAEIHERLPDLDEAYKNQANEYSRFQISLLKSLKLRSDSNQARLATEITFAFNSLSRQDNHLVKSISLLTMVFFPAMFVSTIFSTSFFDLGDKGWEVSGKIWILWVTIVLATIIVMIAWQVWLAKDERILRFLQRSGASVKRGVRSVGERDVAPDNP